MTELNIPHNIIIFCFLVFINSLKYCCSACLVHLELTDLYSLYAILRIETSTQQKWIDFPSLLND